MWPSYQHLLQCSEVKVVDWQCWGSEKGCGRRQVSVWDCGLMADLGKSRFPLSGGPAFSRCDLMGPLFSNNNYWLFFFFRTWLVVKKGACISLTSQMPHGPCFSTWRHKVGIHTCASMFGIFHLQGCYSWNCKNLLSFWWKNLKKIHHVKTVLSPICVTHSNGCTYQEYLQKHYDCHKSSIHLLISINQLFFFLTCYILLIVVFRFFSIPMSVLPTVKSSSEIYGKLVRQ